MSLSSQHVFRNRREAGQFLAEKLARYRHRKDTVVLALPRGGVPVGFEVARALGAPLDVLVVRKLGLPGRSELAMGAVAGARTRVLNDQVIEQYGIPAEIIEAASARARRDVERREEIYRAGRPAVDVRSKIAIVVDDGLATGSTMRAALAALRELGPARIVAAVPAGAERSCKELERHADEVVCASAPAPFYAVGAFYHEFPQVADSQVRELLSLADSEHKPARAPSG